jgi:hypothetical protein
MMFRFAFAIVVFTAFRVAISIPVHLVFDALKSPVASALGRGDNFVWQTTTAIGAFVLHHVADGPPVHEMRTRFSADRTTSALPDLIGLVTIALTIAIIWAILDRRQENYVTLNRWMRVYLRYAVGGVMLHYAFIKVIPTQFGFLTPAEMLHPLGYLTPFRLLWNFMAASSSYTIFTGLVELLGATLLFFRRTTLLGCLVLCGALMNVVVMDLAYEVGAVTYADTLLLYVIFLLAPYLQPLSQLLLGQRETALPVEPSPVRRRWYHSPVAKAVAVCLFVFPLVQINIERRRSFFGAGQPVYGLFEVTRFVRNGRTIIPLASDAATWKRVASDRFNSICVQFANADVRRFQFKNDSIHRVWTISDANPANAAILHYSVQQNGDIALDGRIGSDPVSIVLQRVNVKQFFPLLRRS